MLCSPFCRRPEILVVGLCLLLSAASWQNADALLIDFEAAQGYTISGGIGDSPANLKGQPSLLGATQWTNPSDGATIRVTDNGAGGQWAQANNNAENDYAGGGAPYQFLPSNSDLGGVFDANSSIVEITFDFTRVAAGTGVGSGQWLIGDDAVRFEFYTDGLIYFYGTQPTGDYVRTAEGGHFVAAAGQAYDFRLTLDYGTNSWRFNVNGVQQMIGGNTDLGFRNVGSTNARIDWYAINIDNPGWTAHAIDNLSIAMVPEPSTIGLMGLFAFSAGWMGWRRKTSQS